MYDRISSAIGIPTDQVKLLCCLLYIFPLGLINYALKSPFIRLVYGFITGILLMYYMYGYEVYHLVIDCFVTYLFIQFFGRKKSGFFILIFTILHLSYIHVNRMIYDYGGWSMDVSGIYMMLVVKFSALTFSYEDGGKHNDELKSEYMKEKKIIEKPTLLETFSFCFHFSSCIVGPSIDFIDFKKYINLSQEYSNIPFKRVAKNSLINLGYFFVYSVLFMIGQAYFPNSYGTTEEFNQRSVLYKLVFIYAAGFAIRTKYYTGWTLGHNAMSFSGLTYSNIAPKNHVLKENEEYHSFDKAKCFDIETVEFDPNIKNKLTVSI